MTLDAKRVRERFWRNVVKMDGCWMWTGCVGGNGYGSFYAGGKLHRAHRYVWMMVHGAFPNQHVCHHCDEPLCVNPDHLFIGSNSDNMLDASRKGRLKDRGKPLGELHGLAKLTEEQVRLIRSRTDTQALADELGVHRTTVQRARRGQQWGHVAARGVE